MSTQMSRFLCNKCFSNNLFKIYFKQSEKTNVIIGRNFSFDLESYGNALIKLNRSIANSGIVKTAKENMFSLHEWLPISWSLEIALITTAIRTLVTFPLIISSRRILNRYENLQPEIKEYSDKTVKEVVAIQHMFNLSPFKAKLLHRSQVKKETNRLIIRDNCHPIKGSLVIWFQIPIWFILSHTIRNMSFMLPPVDNNSQLIHSQLSNEGILWFTDLTQTDPYYVLPLLVAAVNLTNIQIGSNERLLKTGKTRMHSIITNVCRGVSLILIPIGMQMPSAVCFYWLMSSSMGLIHNLILTNPNVKHQLGIHIKPMATDLSKKTH